MGEWLVCKGDPTRDPVSLARDREVLEYELDGHPFVFSCEVVPNARSGRGVAVMMHLAERGCRGDRPVDDATAVPRPVQVDDLAAAFDDGELPRELDLATLVTCRSRAEWLFASAADLIETTTS
jgi:hypothetical protein